ncbi:DNA mismatch repair protein MutS [Eubacterium ruminantium]|nr:DNA mismatch repair protein MutS [Eubacterium ruminantium]
MAEEKLSPMMEHYLKTKDEYKDTILFYRLGDFYEMFFDDAILVSKELELTLTGKDCGLKERAPMCGVPFHAADVYISKLVDLGYKVAVCEQVQDPKLAKGLVERKVIKIVTPGTNMAPENLSDDRNNYIMCISYNGEEFGIAVSDISTGIFMTTVINDKNKVFDEINKFEPSEIIYQELFEVSGIDLSTLSEKKNISCSVAPARYFSFEDCSKIIREHFKVSSLEGLGLKDFDSCIISCGALLKYLYETQMSFLSQINTVNIYFTDQFMLIDSATRRNLELTETLRDKKRKGSLLGVLDRTKTAMGARKLRSYVEQPLLDKKMIEKRLDAISSLNDNIISRDEMREYLGSVYDLERLMTRISIKTANPRDLLSFRNSLKLLPFIKNLISEYDSEIFRKMAESFDPLSDIYELLESAIAEDAPITVKEGGIFKPGYCDRIDEYKEIRKNAKDLLAALEERERDKTGIKNIKVKYNKVFGYYIEVTNSFKDKVPDYFIRKQTLTNAERYTTNELNELSDKILGAEDKLYALEYDEYTALRDRIAAETVRVQQTAEYIAVTDALASLSYVAVRNNYVRPAINEDGVIDIKGGRHPVVEKMIPGGSFVPNDTFLDNVDNRISIITGPNMAGKSTYMRQSAIIVLMAQMGSFVPADFANISLCDRIFTRVGASDDLASGQSTFMVEMSEVANILRNATRNSLIILDEIGRGTSTFDGLSIAWAVVEYIADSNILGAKTLFATHYHELTELEGKLSSVNNYCIAIKQQGESIVFIRKIIRGGIDRSYGIEVARLAGVPEAVIKRAKDISEFLAEEDITGKVKDIKAQGVPEVSNAKKRHKQTEDFGQLSFFGTAEEISIANELKELDLNNMTPMKAMLYLQELKRRLNGDAD